MKKENDLITGGLAHADVEKQQVLDAPTSVPCLNNHMTFNGECQALRVIITSCVLLSTLSRGRCSAILRMESQSNAW